MLNSASRANETVQKDITDTYAGDPMRETYSEAKNEYFNKYNVKFSQDFDYADCQGVHNE